MADRAPDTAAGIPYEGTDCTADEAVEAVKAVRATAAPCCCRGLIGNTNYMCLARGLDLDPPHCGDECPERPACIEANDRAASIPYEGTDCTPEEAVEAVKAVRATAAREDA